MGSVAALAFRGYADRALGAPVELLPILFFCWLTGLLTEDPPEVVSGTQSMGRLLTQTVAVVAITVLIGLSAMGLYGVGPHQLAAIPVWSGLFNLLISLGRTLPFSAPAAISNPILYVALPLVLLLALGARWRELGFGPGHRVGRVLLLWSVPQLVRVAIAAGVGHIALSRLVFVFLRNGFQNGPVEEFLFRGALQTRLALLMGGGWGLVLSALAFGVWHLGVNALGMRGDLFSAACAGITGQAAFGLAQGVIFQRTRNLLASSILHMLFDLP